MPESPALFPSFFLGGYECSSHVYRTGTRQDLLARTQHLSLVRHDYELLRSVGILGVREGLRWHLWDQGRRIQFGSAARRVQAAKDIGLVQVWDIFHYGYPDDLDPLHPRFASAFADFAYQFSRWYSRRVPPPRFYAPLNEPSFFAWAAGEVRWFAPFLTGKGWELKVALARAALAGIDAVRAADAESRILSIDPIIHAVAPAEAPELAEDAARFTEYQYQSWDMLAGRLMPDLGGRPDYLDLIGVNYYPTGQWEHGRAGYLALDDPRRKPFRDMLVDVYRRYRRQIVITETGCWDDLRPAWLHYIIEECLAAMQQGVDLGGICLYPVIGMPDWHDGHFMRFGLWDLVRDGTALRRVPYQPYLKELRRAQLRLERSEVVAESATAARGSVDAA